MGRGFDKVFFFRRVQNPHFLWKILSRLGVDCESHAFPPPFGVYLSGGKRPFTGYRARRHKLAHEIQMNQSLAISIGCIPSHHFNLFLFVLYSTTVFFFYREPIDRHFQFVLCHFSCCFPSRIDRGQIKSLSESHWPRRRPLFIGIVNSLRPNDSKLKEIRQKTKQSQRWYLFHVGHVEGKQQKKKMLKKEAKEEKTFAPFASKNRQKVGAQIVAYFLF